MTNHHLGDEYKSL